MSKAVLVIGEQRKCDGCPLKHFDWNSGYSFCRGKKRLCDNDIYVKVPDWCPLNPLPHRYEDADKNVVDYKLGWNDCLYEIGGDDDD